VPLRGTERGGRRQTAISTSAMGDAIVTRLAAA
jgi:hypothetical protein